MEVAAQLCPRCGLPRIPEDSCPRCGIVYAKAEARARPEAIAPPVIDAPASWTGEADDARRELWIRVAAVPAALLGATAVVNVAPLHTLTRMALTMPVHELGHAVTAWFCGFAAVPFLWVTHIPEARSLSVPLVLTCMLALWTYRTARTRRWVALAAAIALVVPAVAGTFGLSPAHAQALITFGGDGGCFVLGGCLMATMYAPVDHPLVRNWLRWGYLCIGAAAFADAFDTWWGAHTDYALLPMGEIEGTGLSDASKLIDVYAWDPHALITRYLSLACSMLILLALLYAVGLMQGIARARATNEK